MKLPIANGVVSLTTADNAAGDVYSSALRLENADPAQIRATTTGGAVVANGLTFDATGRLLYVDATAGLPAGTVYSNGLPISNGALCISTGSVASNACGIPFALNGAVAASIASSDPVTITATGTQFLASASASYRVTASKLYLQSTTGNKVSSFTFMAKGTSATLDLRNDAASYPNAVRVSVDNSALAVATNVGSVYTLFTGLSDTWHKVTIQTGTAWGDNNLHLLPSVASLSVTGVGASWLAPSYWLHPGDVNALIHTTGALSANVTDYVPAFFHLRPVVNTSNVGTVRFRAAATKLFIYSNSPCLFYTRNGGSPVRIPVSDSTGTVVEGLDGTEATYNVWCAASRSGTFLSVGTDATLVDVGTKKRMDQFGDSITAADSVAGTADQNRGDSDVLGVAAALGFAGATYGISGQTIAQLKTNIVTQLAAMPAAGSSDVAVLAIGRNNLVGDMDPTEQADYSAIIDSLIAKGYGRVICRGVLPDSSVWTAFNAGIESVVTAKADPKVVYLNTNAWSGIATGDGTHPTIAGYATIRAYAIPAYTPLLP